MPDSLRWQRCSLPWGHFSRSPSRQSSAVEAYCLIPGTVHAPHVNRASVLFASYEESELVSKTPFCVPDVEV